MEVKDVFSANPKSVWEYLCENGQGLYIPAYQRQYAWDKNKIQRLLEDTWHGFSLLVNHEDAITFLGTLIAIHDTQLVTVNPIVREDVPSKVMTVIDGQQRLTTLIVLNTVLHEEISIKLNKLREDGSVFHSWLKNESLKVISRLRKTYEEDKDYGDYEFRFYPRMIRAYEDSWSRVKLKASYASPIGSYLHKYGIHSRSDDVKKVFIFDLPSDEREQERFKPLLEGRKEIQKLVRTLSSSTKNEDFPSLSGILESEYLQTILMRAEFPADVKDALLQNEDSPESYLFRLVLFANFVLDRVALTIVTAKNEDYAFDMFESLNTTGEPLTAFETFKPRVIHAEGIEEFEQTETFKYLKTIEDYLEQFTTSNDKKQNETSRLIVNFALAENGQKVSKRLNEQRRFFKDSFESLVTKEDKRKFVQHLSHLSLFMKHSWPEQKIERAKLHLKGGFEDSQVLLCLEYLRQFNHSITISLIARYYSALRVADGEKRQEAFEMFVNAVKMVTAFSTFWRGSRNSTEGIDSIYRGLMDDGYEEVGLAPLARQKTETPPNISLVKSALRHILADKGGIVNKADWSKKASKVPAYKNQLQVTRFLLLAASHDTVDDDLNPGLLKAAKSGTLDLFNLKSWLDVENQTVEHVANQRKEPSWLDELYENNDDVHRLGNLTLLPVRVNSSIGNSSWSKKKLMYKLLSSKTEDQLDSLLDQARAQGIEVPDSTENLLNQSKYLPMVSAISNLEGDWNMDVIERRSVRISELAWERLWPWLEG